MEKKRSKRVLDCCFENDETYEIGEQWTDHNYCNLKTCERGGRISVKLCPPLDLSSGCSKIEGDFNQQFPQCCPDVECSRNEPSSESSSSSSSSDEDEEDLFDDEGDLDVFSFEDPSNQPVDRLGEDSVSRTKIDSETETSKDFSKSQIQIKNFDDNKPNKYIIRFTPNTNTSRENTSANNKDSATSLRSNDAVLKDITNRGESTGYESSSQLERHTETQVHRDVSEDKYNKETKFTSEALRPEKDSANITEDKGLDTQWIGVSKALDSISENKTLVGSINTTRENVPIELTDPENGDLACPSQNNCEDSMDNINFSARELDEKNSLHTTDAEAEHLETPHYKTIDYLDDVQDDRRFKELNDKKESTTDDGLQDKHEVTSITLETRQNIRDFENIDDKTTFGDDKTYLEDTPILGEKSPENAEEEEVDGHNLTNTEDVLYKTESSGGVIYNPVDSEGFLINPKDNVAIGSSNVTISDGRADHTQNHSEESSHPGLQDKISYELEIPNNTNENYDEESNRIIGSEEMLNTNENIDTHQNNDTAEEYTNANTQHVDVLDTETNFFTDVDVEENQLPPQVYESIDSTGLNDDNEDNEEIPANNENIGSLDGAYTDQILEENQTTNFNGHHADVEDNESVKSFDLKAEDNIFGNDEDDENIDGADHEIIAPDEQEDLPVYVDAENQLQDFEEPIQPVQTFQNADEEEEEDDYNPAQDFENNSSELAEEETNYTTTEQSSQVEGSSEYTTEVTDIFDTAEEDD